MHVSRLALDHFRSWEQCVLDLAPGVNVLQGANGLGKTNIVEAVEVLSTGSSHRTSSSLPLIERGRTSATIRANVETGPADETRVTTYEVTVAARGANRGRINSGASLYMRDIAGKVPSVAFVPEDQRLVSGDPAGRRSFLDQAGVQLVPGYASLLHTVAQIARQRAALLKQLADRSAVPGPADAALSGLEIWTGQFIEAGVELTRRRASLVERLRGPFSRIHAALAGDTEHAELTYLPSFAEVLDHDIPGPAISEHFQRIYLGEVSRGVNLIGPQRDDLGLGLNGMDAREYASNGEMWTMALALKMALFAAIGEDTDVTPILILDDVFAQLDEHRRRQILDFAAHADQTLITVAAAGDLPRGIADTDARIIDVEALRKSAAAPEPNQAAV